MTKGTIYIEGKYDTERLTTLLADNGYTVQVSVVDGYDVLAFEANEYEIKYKRKDEYDD